ncbi:MAG: helix-turn-helix domain-containing protein [Cyanobacteria bacterium SID2]|nr:helix-turn-helix domain-containing protein [Cyanobacteria bacterium SID2]MBP0003108.1 helix-turn-helix domain-containing protein [Cyanobacteria bacterium SBC]
MQETALSQGQINSSPSQPSPAPTWEHIRVQQLRNPAGEGPYHREEEHTLFVSLAPRPIRYLQAQDGKTHTGLYRKGDLSITPANTPLFVRWEGDENCLQIQLTAQFLQSVARETLDRDGDRLELVPTFQTRDCQLEAIATMLLAEIQQNPSGNRLYVDSLANILAVNLLRQHATTQPQLPIYEGGLPQRQLMQVLDYIDAHLDRDIKLASLAKLLDMSQFHFSHLFKQSIGISPYQYLLQQRVERAKQLLKQTDRLIVDIALECGFNSHSHLSQQFRKLTGMTPKAYRVS